MKGIIHLLMALAILVPAWGASTTSAQFDLANIAYQDGKYVEAREGYEALLAKGEKTANIYYNLGNTNARIGAQGLAILNYERALALDPSHAEARANLKFLREQSTAKVPIETWQQRAFGALTLNGWIIAFSALAWIALYLMVIPLLRRRRLTASGVFALVLALCGTVYAGYAAWFAARDLDAAVVIVKQIEARRAPADRAELADVLPSGSKVRWLSERSGWVECEMPDGSRGWLPAGSLERVRPTS